MAPTQLEISIPNTTVSRDSKPFTVYNINLRLPLRSYTTQKRYSDFLVLHKSISEQAGAAPTTQLPSKSWFSKSVNNSELTEERRASLERYLQAINSNSDPKWRNTSAWRAFLNLPSSFASQSDTKLDKPRPVVSSSGGGDAPITDPVAWLDRYKALKSQLHDARLNLTIRDQATTAQKQHEASVTAKGCLVKAESMIVALEEGLTNIQKAATGGWGSQSLGDGEIRRRRDLIAVAKKDRDGLENLLDVMNTKTKLDQAVASIPDKESLVGPGKPKTGRVLGKETAETRELDNQGLLQLQQQRMKEQDLDVDELRKIIQRQKELGIAINQELEVQNEMLLMVEEDVDRVQGKVSVAKKRTGKIK